MGKWEIDDAIIVRCDGAVYISRDAVLRKYLL